MEVNFLLDEIHEVAKAFIAATVNHKVFAMHGEMGAGKTTFVHALCEALGVKDAISSPTFSIVNQYKADDEKVIYHIDLYRLKDEEEAIQAGIEDCLYSGNTCFVEWPDRAAGIFPDDTLHVKISIGENNSRKIEW
ncbi:tRNA (adenosine(37)-N6)-threonylcarbamoyltransferase complex ATPase subunit type 1 TsaE [Ferruginibacter lapsinanis]|uniref:tRNA (adenosine(37)-N6)-threonylcarbamoyltransferase complex ATPase subunit type 1 TsaE n=1 Tax=Ferruginibacter lapsinanis TaxID=563172 RepID=UPI001E3BB1FC|nr:tRNA (adenosine(37)-N6)-threonylcarbamoyltransferase complex ATPase subunit type 1 TsaE [Ferruginibacter lapsinanis]UEG51104.1 tRNA (adenosine(37)-N6)-threonylcarbamoyltransferase complex ATPase subunit type 1 TsaE [Ferruginibacter lapsinanis]